MKRILAKGVYILKADDESHIHWNITTIKHNY